MSSTFSYTVTLPPTISGVSPASGPSAGGTTVTVTGALDATTVVTVGTTIVGFTQISPSEISFVTPPGTGSSIVSVSNVAGTATASFLYIQPQPAITAPETPLTSGSEQPRAFDVIRSHFNAALFGRNWNALLEALATADDYIQSLAVAVFDQLFKPTASGKYLDILAWEDGTVRPVNVGMSDDTFRELSIELSTGKVTYNSILRILEAFYGKEALRAHMDTQPGPFVLADGQTLVLKIDGSEYTFTVDSSAFRFVNAATASELAIALSIFFQDAEITASAAAITDPDTDLQKVRIFSGSLGLRGSVSVVGGTAQPFLGFGTEVEVHSGTVVPGDNYQWDFSVLNGKTTVELVFNTPTLIPPKIDISGVWVGDYLVIGQDVSVVAGWYRVSSVQTEWSGTGPFAYTQTLVLDGGTYTGSVTQQSNDSFRFFRPTTYTILSGPRTISVSQTSDGVLDVTVPATVSTERDASTGGYLSGTDEVEISSIFRRGREVSVTTNGNHGLVAGDTFFLDGFQSAPSRAWVDVVGGKTNSGSFVHTLISTPNISANPSDTAAANMQFQTLLDGNIIAFGGTDASGVPKNQVFKITQTLGVVSDGSGANGATSFALVPSVLSPMSASRAYAASSALQAPLLDSVLVTGGTSASIFLPTALATCELLTGSGWTSVANMAQARMKHVQFPLDGGLVMVAGGATAVTVFDSTEIYDPVTNSWSAGPSMQAERQGHVWVRLNDGRVFVAGGTLDVRFCDIYDGVQWTATPEMSVARNGCGVALLPTGEVLVFGGSTTLASQTSEIYDPVTNVWRHGPKLPSSSINFANNLGGGWYAQVGDVLYMGGFAFTPAVYWTDLSNLRWNVLPATARSSGSASIRKFATSNGRYVLLSGSQSGVDNMQYFDAIVGDGVSSNPTGLSGLHKAVSASGNILTFVTPESGYATNLGTESLSFAPTSGGFGVTPSTWAAADDKFGSPTLQETDPVDENGVYILDPDGQTTSVQSTTLTQAVVKGTSYDRLSVASTEYFPDEQGWIVIGLGTATESKPIRYLQKLSSTELLMDGFVAPSAWSAGESATYVSMDKPTEIESAAWVTGSVLGGIAAKQTVLDSMARDVDLNWSVIYPSDRGLGAEGTDRSDKLSVWGPDDVSEEEDV